MTAVEYIRKRYYQMNGELSDKDFEQADIIFEDQLKRTIIASEKDRYNSVECWPIPSVTNKAEQYYKETFKSE